MKTVDPGDPMELVGVALPQADADYDYMAQCLVEEYVMLGWNDAQLMSVFTQPNFQATHRIYRDKGEQYVRSLIQRVREKWSRGRIREGVSDA